MTEIRRRVHYTKERAENVNYKIKGLKVKGERNEPIKDRLEILSQVHI